MQHLLFEKLSELKCDGMRAALQEQMAQTNIDSLAFEQRLLLLLDREITRRNHRRLQLRLKQAKLKQMACLENIDFKVSRGLDKAQILSLASCQWIKEHHNILLVGATGTGKSYLACALGHKACLEGFSAIYLRLPRLFQELLIAKGDGRYSRQVQQLAKADVLILDLW
jgi:DNA replication protein DnaC